MGAIECRNEAVREEEQEQGNCTFPLSANFFFQALVVVVGKTGRERGREINALSAASPLPLAKFPNAAQEGTRADCLKTGFPTELALQQSRTESEVEMPPPQNKSLGRVNLWFELGTHSKCSLE